MNPDMTSRRTSLGALAAATLVPVAALPAHAQDELVLLETTRTTTYINGGVGKPIGGKQIPG